MLLLQGRGQRGAGIVQASVCSSRRRPLVVTKAALLVSKDDQGPAGLTTQNSLAGLGILKKLPFLPSNALRPEQIMADRCFMLPEDGTTGVVTLLRPTKENGV
jgi:hypothetical protein